MNYIVQMYKNYTYNPGDCLKGHYQPHNYLISIINQINTKTYINYKLLSFINVIITSDPYNI